MAFRARSGTKYNDVNSIYNIYRALNDRNARISDDSIKLLQGSKCVFIEGFAYCKATECFWNSHPFGLFRHRVGDQLRNFYSFLKRIGVEDEPKLEDYIEVLEEISEAFGNNNKPLDEITQAVVKIVYSFLALHLPEVSDETLSELHEKKVVLDRSRLLRIPGYLFFENKGIAVDIFRQRLETELIDKKSVTVTTTQKVLGKCDIQTKL